MCGLWNDVKKVGSKIEDVAKFEIGHARDIFKDIGQDPERLLLGAVDPFSTKVWNKALGKEWDPLVNQLGGATDQRYADAEMRGLDTGFAHELQNVAGSIAGFMGGQGLYNTFGGAGGMFGSGGSGAGAGSSAYEGAGSLSQLGETYAPAAGSGSGGVRGMLGGLFGGGGTGGAGAGGGMMGGVGDLLRGGFGLYQANQLRQAGQPSAVNQQAEAQLLALMQNPNSITSMPGYNAGIEAVQRGMASQGFLNSGNMATALQQYGGNFYNNAVSQLQGLSQSGRGNEAAYRTGSINLAGQAMNSLGYGAMRLFGR